MLPTKDIAADADHSSRCSANIDSSLSACHMPAMKQIFEGVGTCSVQSTDRAPATSNDKYFSTGEGVMKSSLVLSPESICSSETQNSLNKLICLSDKSQTEPDKVMLDSVDFDAILNDASSLSDISIKTDASMSICSQCDDIDIKNFDSCDKWHKINEAAFKYENSNLTKSYSIDSGFCCKESNNAKNRFAGLFRRNSLIRRKKEEEESDQDIKCLSDNLSSIVHSHSIQSLIHEDVRSGQLSRRSKSNGKHLDAMFTALILEDRPEGVLSKPKEEDERHRMEYNTILANAKKKAIRDRDDRRMKLQQKIHLEDNMSVVASIWKDDVIPNWEGTHRSKKVRRLWWLGLPSSVRGKVWRLAIGNDLNITNDLYQICQRRAQECIQRIKDLQAMSPDCREFNSDPPFCKENSIKVIKLDISRTFPQLIIFQKVQGMSFIAAILLLNMDLNYAFTCFTNLLNRPCLMAFFSMDHNMMSVYYEAYSGLLLENLPCLFQHFADHQVSPNLYLMEWVFLLYSRSLPLDVACRVWDMYCRDGEDVLFQVAIGILKMYERVLMSVEFIHIVQHLKHLPDDINVDSLFRHVKSVHMTVERKTFHVVLAAKKEAARTIRCNWCTS